MEHLIVLLVEFARWLDRLFLKSLARAVPELPRLREDPRGTLAAQTITIGPARKYGSGLLLGALLGLGVDVVLFIAFVLVVGPRKFPLKGHPELVALLVGLLVVGFVLSCWLVLRGLRGGRAILTDTGVELTYRRTTVFCPWALFHAPGQPFLPRRDMMLLPISPAGLPLVEARKNENVLATGTRVKTWQIHFRSNTEAVLRPVYEVTLTDLGGLLLELGRVLGAEALGGKAAPALPPGPRREKVSPAVPERDGWLTVRLTRLVFPPFCCDCGSATDQTQEVRGYAPLLRLGRFQINGGDSAVFQVPVCPECQSENGRRCRRAALRGVLTGVGVPFLIGAGLALFFQTPQVLLMLIPLEVFCGLMGYLVGRDRGRRQAAPVQMERYAPAKGTIAIRFRWTEYGDRLLAFLEAQEELPGVMPLRKVETGG